MTLGARWAATRTLAFGCNASRESRSASGFGSSDYRQRPFRLFRPGHARLTDPALPTILLTGATGYIGSHTWLALARAGFDVVGVDDFSNSSPQVLVRLHSLLGHTPRSSG